MRWATVAVSPFKALWALMPTSLSETTEVGGLPALLLPYYPLAQPASPLPTHLGPPPNRR